jgi:CubicO group peptidase (beta-lactamase class C family)
MTVTYPEETWERVTPDNAGLDPSTLSAARHRQRERADGEPYRVVIVRGGRVVAEWNEGIDPDERLKIASATKSVLSCALGIAIDDGRLPSADAKLADYYPEALDVLPGEGPKENRHARAKDREITFRQLLSNTSGYMKPDEPPGEVFHYQTFGMNVAGHAIAKRYGFWDADDPENSRDVFHLYETRLRIPMRADWTCRHENFDLQPGAKLGAFGYNGWIEATALDMARLGWLWCNWGAWRGEQLVPEDWLREATQTAATIEEHCPEEEWQYGYGFWTNDHQRAWPELPARSFAAVGAGGHHVWVWPERDVVVVHGPGTYDDKSELGDGLLGDVVDAVEDGPDRT